ncbi:family 4 glycosyl hydrolase [Lacticaseibacillus daqingensis]|uniref:family 4 glycosyl hydrolase n=1 Tax=Lacticaseibacillus daqingensis TaxID=2486014 RepID=UPI000F7690F1|nr:6-phospho-alpha-glucosidase [Lacticaseibacillus daqingensis]
MSYVITIAGGGSGHTPGILLTALRYRKEFLINEIRLYDTDEVRNEDMRIIMDFLLKREHEDVKLVATSDPKDAFTGCDFIFSQIRVGGMEMRELDEKIPLKYGLVGQETCGLGGFAYGMRTMKGFTEMVGFIQQYPPDAWILNYTNPETIVSETVRRQFPNIKIINACDMTIGIEMLLERSFGYDRKNLVATYYGLNHFGWYHDIYDVTKGRDVMPEILEKIKQQGFNTEGTEPSWAHTWNIMADMQRVFPDNLMNNYLQYYLFPDKIVESANPTYTRANEIMDGRNKTIKENVAKIQENRDLDTIDYKSVAHGQYIVEMAMSIIHNQNKRFMLIVPNMGAIPNLRPDAVVEIPCYVNAKGVEPISLRFDIPDFQKGLMEAQVAAEKLLVDAFFENSYQKALEAFTLNQTVPNATVAKNVLDDFIAANGDYWVNLK